MLAYQLKSVNFTVADLEEKIGPYTYRPLSHGQMQLTTFSAINGNYADYPQYVMPIQDRSLNTIGVALCVNISKRNIPPKVVEGELKKRVKKIESTGQKLEKKDIKELKEQVVAELVDQAFANEKEIDYFIDFKNQIVFAGATSEANAEKGFALIRKMLGSFSVIPLMYEIEINRKLNQIFVQGTTTGADSEYVVSNKFKLSEVDQTNCTVTNNQAEYSLPALRTLVDELAMEVTQLEILNEKLNYSITKSKSGSNSLLYKNIRPTIEYGADLEMSEDRIDEARQMIATLTLDDMNKIVEDSKAIFGGLIT